MYVAIDMGGTNTRIAVFQSVHDTVFEVVERFPTEARYHDQVERIHDTVCRLPGVHALGFAVGAQLTQDGMGIDATYTMPDFTGKPIVSDIAARTGLSVRAANDNVCANLAETIHGSLAPHMRAAYLTVSTGTGAGIRLGFPHQGAVLYLAQVGHHMVYPNGERCTCGQIGCVQSVTGGQSIVQRYGVPASQLQDVRAWQFITQTIAIAIVNMARITRIQAVCVGGGIGCNAPYLRAHLAELVREKSPNMAIAVHFPVLGEEAPIIGTMALLRDDLSTTLFH